MPSSINMSIILTTVSFKCNSLRFVNLMKTVDQAQTVQQDEFRVKFLQQEEKINKLEEQLEISKEHENELNANLDRANKTIHLLNIEKESSK